MPGSFSVLNRIVIVCTDLISSRMYFFANDTGTFWFHKITSYQNRPLLLMVLPILD